MTSASLKRAFAETEKNGEITASVGRLIIALTLVVSAWLTQNAGPASYPLLIATLIYAFLSLVGFLLALKEFHFQLLPYVFATFDMAVVAFALTMLAQMHELTVTHEFSLPLFSLSFVVLIHASLRYRPSLIVYSFMVFLLFLLALPPIMNVPFISNEILHKTHGHEIENVTSLLRQDIGLLPMLFLTAAMVLLFIIVKRTRTVTELALQDAQKASQLSRFFSPGIVDDLVNVELENASSGKRINVAILFIDIRRFSSLAESLSPEELSRLLSDYRKRVCEVVLENGGSVDKFIGDGILAIFGAPISHENDANNAIHASLRIIEVLSEWNDLRDQLNQPRIHVGIGGHFGEVFAGIIESGEILEHTVLGDVVNISERLERLTRQLNSKFVFSDALFLAAKFEFDGKLIQSKEGVELRGHKGRQKIWHD